MKKLSFIIGFICIGLGILLDQIIKIVVRANMEVLDKIRIIPGFFSITHIENTGAAWGGLADNTILLIIISFVLIAVLLYYYRLINFKTKKLYSISLTLMISGAFGNLIDRLAFRSVTDYLDFIIFGYDFPVFNLADCLLVVGFFIFAIMLIRSELNKKEVINNEGTDDNNE